MRHLKNEREARFCALYVRELVALVSAGGSLSRREMRAAAGRAVGEAGYPEQREVTRERKAERLLDKERVTIGITEAFAQIGFDGLAAAGPLLEIMTTPFANDKGITPDHKIKVAELYIKATTGFAPTRSANLNANVPVDAFYDGDAFKKTPPIKTVGSK